MDTPNGQQPASSAATSCSDEVVHGFTLPNGADASSLDWWPEFAAYFEKKEGFAPHPRDSDHKRAFEYFVEGAYRQFQQNAKAER